MQKLKPIIIDAPQRSDEWYKARLGKVTGSNVSKTMAFYVPTKTQIANAVAWHKEHKTNDAVIEQLAEKYPFALVVRAGIELQEKAERKSYRENIVGERLTGLQADPDPYVTYDMKWGMISEDTAKVVYQMERRMVVDDAPFMLHPELACGASPDGIATDMTTGEIGNVEVKCLRTANHLYKIIKEECLPEDYHDQVHMQMWIDNNNWCDFIGFDSRLKDGLKIFVTRVPRDDFFIDEVMEPCVRIFLSECDNDERFFRAKIREREEAKQSE